MGLITPWNFPVAIRVWKLAPALIDGNTVVEVGYEAPRTGLHIAECFAEAGLPAGVLDVSTGAARRSVRSSSRTATCVRSPSPGRSPSVALSETKNGTDSPSPAELGGHNPFIVMADAELDRAAEAAFAGALWSAGESAPRPGGSSSRTRLRQLP